MSREWYIRTDKRNIQDTFDDIDTTPVTLREKWKKHYKKYILWMVEIAVLVGLLIWTLPMMFPKDTADYAVTIVTASPITDKAIETVENELKPFAQDRNGDGTIQFEVRTLSIAEAEEGARNTALEQLITTFKGDRYTLIAIEPVLYERYVKSYTADGQSMFAAFEGANSQEFLELQKTEHLPKLWWGVRVLPESDWQTAHRLLLEQYANSKR